MKQFRSQKSHVLWGFLNDISVHEKMRLIIRFRATLSNLPQEQAESPSSNGYRQKNQFWIAFGEWHENKGNPDDRHAYGKMPGTRSG